MEREFSVRVPDVSRAPRAPGTTGGASPTSRELPSGGRGGDVRARAVYVLAERRGRREHQGQAKLVLAAIRTLRSAAGLETRRRGQGQRNERT